MARNSSGFSRKSRKPELWMETYVPLTSFAAGAADSTVDGREKKVESVNDGS